MWSMCMELRSLFLCFWQIHFIFLKLENTSCKQKHHPHRLSDTLKATSLTGPDKTPTAAVSYTLNRRGYQGNEVPFFRAKRWSGEYVASYQMKTLVCRPNCETLYLNFKLCPAHQRRRWDLFFSGFSGRQSWRRRRRRGGWKLMLDGKGHVVFVFLRSLWCWSTPAARKVQNTRGSIHVGQQRIKQRTKTRGTVFVSS